VLLRLCGFSAVPVHGTELSNKQLVMLRWDSSRIMFIKYVTFAGKQDCFPEPVCNISCCGLFQVSFPKELSNLIVCKNFIWMVFQPNFYLLCVVCLQGRHEGNSQRLQFINAMLGKANNVHPVFPPRCFSNENSDRPCSVRITRFLYTASQNGLNVWAFA